MEKILELTGGNKKIAFKVLKAGGGFLKSLLAHGNKKLADYTDENGHKFRYFQFNLPAKITCPYKSKGCDRFCYAKKDERYTNVRLSRLNALENAKQANFADNMIYTIAAHFTRPIFTKTDDTMILRLHESGDFFNRKYLENWVKVFNAFSDNDRVIFQFYTKCFKYLIDLAPEKRKIINDGINAGRIGLSLSKDDTMTAAQLARLELCRKLYPGANVYYCTADQKALAAIPTENYCNCANCAKCRHCVHTNGREIGVKIHG